MAPSAKSTIKGQEIVDPQTAVYVKLDEISRMYQREFKAQRDVLVQILNTDMLIQEDLKAMRQQNPVSAIPVVEKLEEIRAQLVDIRDEGDYYPDKDTAGIKEKIYDLNEMFGHSVKQLVIKNDSKTTTLRVAFISRLDLTLGNFADERYFDVNPREEYTTPNNIKVIWRIGVKTNSGTANYRLWLHW